MKKLLSKITLVTFLIACVAVMFGGCYNYEYEYTQEEVVAMVNASFDTAPKLVSITKDTDADGNFTNYTFETDKGIEFSVITRKAKAYYTPDESGALQCNYIESVYKHLYKEILELNTTYGIEFYSEFPNNGSCMDSYIVVSDFAQLEKIVDYISAFHTIVKEYIPNYDADTALFSKYTDNGLNGHLLSTKSHFNFTASAEGIELIDVTLTENTSEKFDKETALKFAQITYADLYRADDKDNEAYKDLPWKNIRTLYINGKKYESNDYSPRFVYNEKDSQYYTAVDNVMDFDSHNSKVNDHANMDIVKNYLGGMYELNHTTNSAEYMLNGNKYVIRVPQEKPDRADFIKNNQRLKITMISENAFWIHEHEEAVFRVISLEDYAKLLNCDYEVSQSERAVYLTSK